MSDAINWDDFLQDPEIDLSAIEEFNKSFDEAQTALGSEAQLDHDSRASVNNETHKQVLGPIGAGEETTLGPDAGLHPALEQNSNSSEGPERLPLNGSRNTGGDVTVNRESQNRGDTPSNHPEEGAASSRESKRGETRIVNGNLEWKDPKTGLWEKAVSLDDLRAGYIAQQAQSAQREGWVAAHPDARGEGAHDETSLTFEHRNWGSDRQDLPKIVWQWAETEDNVRPNVGVRRDEENRIILDPQDNPVRDIPGLPLTLSSKTPGWKLEALRRTTGANQRDLWALMPRRVLDGGKWSDLKGVNSVINMPMSRFRERIGCPSFGSRKGSMELKDKVLEIMHRRGFDPRPSNSIEGFGRDLTSKEIDEVRAVNKGQHPERARIDKRQARAAQAQAAIAPAIPAPASAQSGPPRGRKRSDVTQEDGHHAGDQDLVPDASSNSTRPSKRVRAFDSLYDVSDGEGFQRPRNQQPRHVNPGAAPQSTPNFVQQLHAAKRNTHANNTNGTFVSNQAGKARYADRMPGSFKTARDRMLTSAVGFQFAGGVEEVIRDAKEKLRQNGLDVEIEIKSSPSQRLTQEHHHPANITPAPSKGKERELREGPTVAGGDFVNTDAPPMDGQWQMPYPNINYGAVPDTTPCYNGQQDPPLDARYQLPQNEAEKMALNYALQPTRNAYFEWTGQRAPETDRNQNYDFQWLQIYAEFNCFWHEVRHCEEVPYLVQLVPWYSPIIDFPPPVKNDQYYMAWENSHRAPRDENGLLLGVPGRVLEQMSRDHRWVGGPA